MNRQQNGTDYNSIREGMRATESRSFLRELADVIREDWASAEDKVVLWDRFRESGVWKELRRMLRDRSPMEKAFIALSLLAVMTKDSSEVSEWMCRDGTLFRVCILLRVGTSREQEMAAVVLLHFVQCRRDDAWEAVSGTRTLGPLLIMAVSQSERRAGIGLANVGALLKLFGPSSPERATIATEISDLAGLWVLAFKAYRSPVIRHRRMAGNALLHIAQIDDDWRARVASECEPFLELRAN